MTEIIELEDDAIELEEAPTAALSPMLQSIARNYIGARARAGGAILDTARYLAEARAAAKYGEWGVFLESTGTTEDTATRMIAIATRAAIDQQYARAVGDGRLALTAAFEILNAPAETQQRALESSAPTPASAIRHAKQESKLRTSAEFVPAPMLPQEEADDSAIIARIRTEAAALGMGVIWEDDTVILHWPDENIEQLMGMGYQDALYWLAGDGVQQAQARAAEPDPAHVATPSDPAIEMEIKRLCAICGARYLGIPDLPYPTATRYRIAFVHPGGGGDYLADEAITKLRAACAARDDDPAHVERLEAQIESDRIPEASMVIAPPAPMLPAVPPRPKRPVSADASAVIAYLKQMEAYASALESVIMALQKRFA